MQRDFGGGARSFMAQNCIIGIVIACSMFFAIILLWPYHVLVGCILLGEGSLATAVLLWLLVKRQLSESKQSATRLQQGELPFPEYREDSFFVPEGTQEHSRFTQKSTQRFAVHDVPHNEPMQQYGYREGR